jgi:hypothetical protein
MYHICLATQEEERARLEGVRRKKAAEERAKKEAERRRKEERDRRMQECAWHPTCPSLP